MSKRFAPHRHHPEIALVPWLQGGLIINNGSISAQVPRPSAIAYAAIKHAISGLTKAAALDGRSFGIAVGQIDIGNVA